MFWGQKSQLANIYFDICWSSEDISPPFPLFSSLFSIREKEFTFFFKPVWFPGEQKLPIPLSHTVAGHWKAVEKCKINPKIFIVLSKAKISEKWLYWRWLLPIHEGCQIWGNLDNIYFVGGLAKDFFLENFGWSSNIILRELYFVHNTVCVRIIKAKKIPFARDREYVNKWKACWSTASLKTKL